MVEGHLSNILMKDEGNWPRGIGEVGVGRFFYFFSSGGHLVYRSGTALAILVGSPLDTMSVKFESHWSKGSGGVSF